MLRRRRPRHRHRRKGPGNARAPIYVRHEIVHNTHVINTLKVKGAVFVKETHEVPEGSIVIFSAHGAAPAVREEAAARGLRAIDVTCSSYALTWSTALKSAAGQGEGRA